MNVLDIDLDFFVDPRPSLRATSGRLPRRKYRAWSCQRVEDFLLRHCNLRKKRPLPGIIVTYHHELFEHWKFLISSSKLEAPFGLTRLDSHADMGMGFLDNSTSYIMGELLHRDLSDRQAPPYGGSEGLLDGNYVSFAIACRWISSLVYVRHPQLVEQNCGLHDIPNCMFRENKPDCNVLQFKRLPPECRNSVHRLENFAPLALEPTVPIRIVERETFQATDSYSFIFAAQSPDYTPDTADPILQVIRQFIQPVV